MPGAGFSLGSNLRVPKVFGGNGISNTSAPAPRHNSRGMMTGKCEWDVYGTQRQRRAHDLKEVERIKQVLDKLQQPDSNTVTKTSSNSSKSASCGGGRDKQRSVQELPTLDESSEGLEARMRAEFVMIKDRLRKMEKDLHQLGTTR